MAGINQNGAAHAPATENLPLSAEQRAQWAQVLKESIQSCAHAPAFGDIKVHTIFDDEHGHYLLFYTGWNGKERVHVAIFHAEIRDGKIHIHWDGAGDGITGELIEAGVPRDRIVLEWQPPYVRKFTPFAVA